MASRSKVYIAGVGLSPSPSEGSPAKDIVASLVSAATKAFLDAGVTYDDVTQGITTVRSDSFRYGSEAFKAFDEEGIIVDEVEGGTELKSSFYWVRDRGAQCVLMIAVDKSTAIAFVLVSDKFLGSHPYLKDSAALIRELNALQSKSKVYAGERIHDVCQMVWALRGWSHSQNTANNEERLIYKAELKQSFELSRVGAKTIPKWEEVEYRQDGKHRLGYNPSTDTREIFQEDFEAVRASGRTQSEANDRPEFDRRGGDTAVLAKL